MVRRGRQIALLGQLAGQLRGHRLRRAVGDGRRVAVPRGPGGELGEVGEPRRSMPPPGPISVDAGSSSSRMKTIGVEELGPAAGRRLAGPQQVRHRRDHEEEGRNTSGAGRGKSGTCARPARARTRSDGGPERQGDGYRHGRAREPVAERRQHQRRDEQPDEHEQSAQPSPARPRSAADTAPPPRRGRTRPSPSAKTRTPTAVFPRAPKNSAPPPSRPNSGWTNGRAHRAPRCSRRSPGRRRRRRPSRRRSRHEDHRPRGGNVGRAVVDALHDEHE